MSVIDFRVRPSYMSEDLIKRFYDVFGYEQPESVKNRSVEILIKELDEAEVVKSVIPGRGAHGLDNDKLFELVEKYPGRFIAYPFLDVTDTDKALSDIDTLIINGKGQGASIEPGLSGATADTKKIFPIHPDNEDHNGIVRYDDERIFPIYEKLERNNIPVVVTISGCVPKVFDPTLPSQVDVVLNYFPNLKFIAGHAVWPFLREMVAIGFKHPNLYLTADFEGTRGTGAHDLRDGAVHMIKNQVLFASSYPLGPIAQGIQTIKDWKLPADVEKKILYDNAAGILGL
ncbi:MAG: amidohydrolase family protein [Acetatifactor sp.]